jgi:hypothetical protein
VGQRHGDDRRGVCDGGVYPSAHRYRCRSDAARTEAGAAMMGRTHPRSIGIEVSLPKRTKNIHLYELAKRGAEVQLQELLHEARLLIGLFPHLRDAVDQEELPLNFIMARASGAVTRRTRRRRRRMSADARAKISAAQKARWAKHKAGGKKQ